MTTTQHKHGSSQMAVGNLYQYASIDVLALYTMAQKQKTHKCYNFEGDHYAEVDLKKTIDAIGKGKVKLRKVGSGPNKGQQCVCIQDLPKDCYIEK